MKNSETYLITTLTPTHVGGSDQISVIDLPIQREQHTTFPKFESSSLKGALRSHFVSLGNNKTELLFGSEKTGDKAASIGFTDARILFFPVKSAKGIFAWITCKAVLHKFMMETGYKNDLIEQIKENSIPSKSNLDINGKVILEEYTFEVKEDKALEELVKILSQIVFDSDDLGYWKDKFTKDVVVLDDDAFRDFVNHSTEVRTRINVDSKTRTVAEGALFNEEYLPEDSILYFLAVAHPPLETQESENEILEEFGKINKSVFQIGANITLGKGFVRLTKLMEVKK